MSDPVKVEPLVVETAEDMQAVAEALHKQAFERYSHPDDSDN